MIYFLVQISWLWSLSPFKLSLAPFDLLPFFVVWGFFEHFLTFWYQNMFQAHLAFPQTWNQLFTKES